MPDETTLSANTLEVALLTEGIKFLYSQAGELIRRWRERRDKGVEQDRADQRMLSEATKAVPISLPADVFEGQLVNPVIHFDVVAASEQELRGLRKDLTDYVEGIEVVNTKDQVLLERVDTLRQLLEAAYRQRITFKGEQRPPSGAVVTGRVSVGNMLKGEAAGVDAEEITEGEVLGEAQAVTVDADGNLYGVKVKRIGR